MNAGTTHILAALVAATALQAAWLAGCENVTLDEALRGKACAPNGACAEGFVCDVATNRCVDGAGPGAGGASAVSTGASVGSTTGSTGGAGGSGVGGNGGATTSTGGSSDVGCSDGTREGFADMGSYPEIASCSGGWTVAGILAIKPASCGYQSGDASSNPGGTGCGVEDLCAPGWHVCNGKDDVAQGSSTGCVGSVTAGAKFFAVRQGGSGGVCGNGSDDVMGCGTLGSQTLDMVSCDPLNRYTANLCVGLPAPWGCGFDSGDEANQITKDGPDAGGVICCRD